MHNSSSQSTSSSVSTSVSGAFSQVCWRQKRDPQTNCSQRTQQSVSDPGVSNVDCYWSCDICGMMCKSQHEFCEDACVSNDRKRIHTLILASALAEDLLEIAADGLSSLGVVAHSTPPNASVRFLPHLTRLSLSLFTLTATTLYDSEYLNIVHTLIIPSNTTTIPQPTQTNSL